MAAEIMQKGMSEPNSAGLVANHSWDLPDQLNIQTPMQIPESGSLRNQHWGSVFGAVPT